MNVERTPQTRPTRATPLLVTLRYALMGALFGWLFPLLAYAISFVRHGVGLGPGGLATIHRLEPLLWIIDSAPLVLGVFAVIIGQREFRLQQATRAQDELVNTLERKVRSRTRELELAALIGRRLTQLRSVEELLGEAVELIRQQYNLYYTQIYLTSANNRTLQLRAGTGPVGEQLVRRSHRLPVGRGSITGQAAATRESIVVTNTTLSDISRSNPLLPESRSAMAVPLIAGDRVIGVLNIQSDRVDDLNAARLPAFEALAGQLAAAIENALLFTETLTVRSEVEEQSRWLARRGWTDFLNGIDRDERLRYTYEAPDYDLQDRGVREAPVLSTPIQWAGEAIGHIDVAVTADGIDEETRRELVAAVGRQVAQQIENLRLLTEAEHYRSEAESAIRRLTRQGWESLVAEGQDVALGFRYDGRLVQEATAAEDESPLKFPLVVQGETVGSLAARDTELPLIEAAAVLTAVSEQLSIHLENLRLVQQTETALAETANQAQRLAWLNELGNEFGAVTHLEQVLSIAARYTTRIVDADSASLTMLDARSNMLTVYVLSVESGAYVPADQYALDETLAGESLRERRLIRLGALTEARGVDVDAWREAGYQSALVAPLTTPDGPLGTLNVASRRSEAFDLRDENIMRQIASLLAATLENRRLLYITRARAERERRVRTITDRIRRQSDRESILRVAQEEIAQWLGASRTSAHLGPEPEARLSPATTPQSEGEG